MAPGAGVESCFGARARALQPRALGHPAARVASGAPTGLCVALRADALTAVERADLLAVDAARLELLPARSSGPSEFAYTAAADACAAARGGAVHLVHSTHINASDPLPAPEVMGIVNATPDSFSDGGLFRDPARAVAHGVELSAAGAHWIDVGGESTRPNAAPVSLEEELDRVLPVVRGLTQSGVGPISIDTRRAVVARAALDAGAELVNDVSGGTHDPQMLALIASAGCRFAIMHMRGTPATMQLDPRYDDPVAEIIEWLRLRVAECLDAGIRLDQLWLDPGIGFGKRLDDNLAILRRLPEFRSLGLPLLLGVSRKSFLEPLTGQTTPSRRLAGTAGAVAACVLGGASVLRLHDVADLADVITVCAALRPDPVADAHHGAAPPPRPASPR